MTRNPNITPTSEQPGTVAPITVSPISGAMTRARNDAEIVTSWLDGMHSAHTRAAFAMTADRFMAQLAARALTLRTLTVEDAREIVAAIGMGMAPSTAAQYAARIKSLLGYAHRIGYAPFNAGAAIRIKGGKVDRAKRIVGETEIALLIRAAPTKRDRLLLEVGYAGGLRVSELVALRWVDVLVRDGDRVQLSVTGKGDKLRHMILPAIVSRTLLAFRGAAGPDDPVFPSRKGGGPR